MSFFKKFDDARRFFTRGLTKNIGKSQPDPKAVIPSEKVKRVFVSRPNARLGNLLLITPLLQEIERKFPQAKVDIFVRGGLAPILFKNYPQVDRIISLPKKPFKNLKNYIWSWIPLKQKRYDVAINVINHSSSGRISTQIANADYKIYGNLDEAFLSNYSDSEHMAKFPVYLLREAIIGNNETKVPNLSLRLDAAELQEAKELVENLVDKDKKTISIFTYATGDKCYSEEWWETFYTDLQKAFPEYNIVEVLPVENISMILFKAPSFYSKDVREIGAFIANTSIFIGADSGIMHLASASGTKTVALFSSTSHLRYGPYGNGNFSIDTNNTSNTEAMKQIKNVLEA